MYHISVSGVKQGPLNEAGVREKIARGEMQPTDLCWREGWPEWKRIGDAFAGLPDVVVPPLPPPGTFPGSFTGTPTRCGLAVVSLVCGICTILLFPLFFVFMIPAIVCGHVAQSRIKEAKGALLGGGMALAGMIMGYLGVVAVPVGGLLAAMAIPAFQKVRTESLGKAMDNDGRQLAATAQLYFIDKDVKSVSLTYDPSTGTVGGPLATDLQRIARGYTVVPEQLTVEGDFQLAHPNAGPPRTYDADGKRRQ